MIFLADMSFQMSNSDDFDNALTWEKTGFFQQINKSSLRACA